MANYPQKDRASTPAFVATLSLYDLVTAMRRVRDSALGKPQKAVLGALLLRCDGSCECWPSVSTICNDTGYSDKWVRVALVWLRNDNLVRWRRTNKSSVYQINVPAILSWVGTEYKGDR